jgi:hypothetical protein
MGYYDEHLDEHRDAQGDIAPPWEKYPTYERYTIGWRMGAGETWLGFVRLFLEQLGPKRSAREAYLRRHHAAPYTWADWVSDILCEDAKEDEEEPILGVNDETIARLAAEGWIEKDASFQIYEARFEAPCWPWTWIDQTPAEAARYWTRDLAFWSRLSAEVRGAVPREVAPPWRAFAQLLSTPKQNPTPLKHGLDALANFLAMGWPKAPWALGLGRRFLCR